MGVSHFGEIAQCIIKGGRPGNTPAIAVRWGTRPDQDVLTGTLETLPALIQQKGLKPPATFIIGEVVGLREKLNWFEKLPLFGQTVVVTRTRDQAGTLTAQLRESGADVIELPTIEIQPASDYGPLDHAISHLADYDWLIFTSANGVRHFLDRLDASSADLRCIRGRICAIGPATLEALQQFHIKVDVLASEYVAEGLLKSLAAFDLSGARILIARAAVARDILPNELRARGGEVDVVEAYRTVPPAGLAERAIEILRKKPDWITFTSSSTVTNLIELIGPAALSGTKAASIGPVTSATLRNYSIEPRVQATEYTVAGLVDAILSATGAVGIIGQ
jgi:uroporphyrinogen III methyltransferase / synthase